jgi:hypothetical protein
VAVNQNGDTVIIGEAEIMPPREMWLLWRDILIRSNLSIF